MNELNYLAYQLAINHFNISIAKDNPDIPGYQIDEHLASRLDSIFNKESFVNGKIPEIKEMGFGRNILIIGAGASMASYDFILTSTKLIEAVHEKLNTKEIFKISKPLWEKYIQQASHITSNPALFSKDFSEIELKKIMKNLGFEDNMNLLINIFNKNVVSKTIESCLTAHNHSTEGVNYYNAEVINFLPSLFYEIVAHLFKHRFFDVIINLNFDELLDNAIIDEMGDSDFHYIVDENAKINLENIFENNRLRVPIYIKPHGTFKSRYSLKFTNEHYIDSSIDVKNLLSKIFDGYVGDKTKNVKAFNIILAGYGLNDIDIREYLFNQFVKKDRLNYFIFDLYPRSIKDKFKKELNKWLEKYDGKDKIKFNIQEKINSCINSKNLFKCDGIEKSPPLTDYFKLLFSKIQNIFRPPFKPNGLSRHVLLTDTFPKHILTGKISAIIRAPEKFYLDKAVFYCLYDFVKFKGKVPINVLTTDRAGRYQQLYYAQIRKGGNKSLSTETNLIGELQEIFSEHDVEVNNLYVYSKMFINSANCKHIILTEVSKKLLLLSENYNQNNRKKRRKEIYDILQDEVYDKRINEINAIYDDNKHGRFLPFSPDNIINTNLELTWRFYEFAVSTKWTELLMIDDTGKPLFNLSKHARYVDNFVDCHLSKMIKAGKKIRLIHSVKKDDNNAFDRANAETNTIVKIKQVFKEFKKTRNFKSIPIADIYQMHKMAIFLNDGEPIFGLYFFKPSTKVRINPVYFDMRNGLDDNTHANLQMMKRLFELSEIKENY